MSHETIFPGANGDREKIIFPVELDMSRTGNHTGLIYTLLKVLTIHVCAFTKFNITAQASPVILVIICYSHCPCVCVCVYLLNCT